MNCYCIKNNNFNFALIEINCYTYIYQDLSEWISPPIENYKVKITPSGSNQQYYLIVNASTNTGIINSTIIGLQENIKLPNGIYTFEATVCDKIFTKKELILCKLKCQYANSIAALNIGCNDLKNKKKLQELSEYQLLFDSIEYNKRCCKWNKVKELIEYLNTNLNGTNETCGCM